MANSATQQKVVLNHLQKIGNLGQLECTEIYQYTRLAAVIEKLRKQGYKIDTIPKNKNDGEKCAVYKFISAPTGE
jgi:hypothetical protein